MLEVASRDFLYFVLRLHDDRELRRVVLLAPGTIANERGEEAGEAIGFVRSDRLETPAEWLRSHVDAEDRL